MSEASPPVLPIGDREIGPGRPCFVIAEAGVNHNGELGLGHRLVDAAADAGADAVKFQTFRASGVASPIAPKAAYQKETTDSAESQLNMLRRLQLSRADHLELMAHAAQRDILFLSTPFDRQSVDLLVELGLDALKISSGELTNRPLLEHVAAQGLPVLLSTGMAYASEVADALGWMRAGGLDAVALLHCVSQYPAPPEEINLKAMDALREQFGVPVGYSDHTQGLTVPIAAAARGACVLEKHFTLSRKLPGPDHKASCEPGELRALVDAVRVLHRALGSGDKVPAPCEAENRRIVRRSLAAAEPLQPGTRLALEHLTTLRPATGIEPARIEEVVGRALAAPLDAGQILRWEDLQ